MAHEESFLDYDKGFRAGTFDKCNGRQPLAGIDLFSRGEIFAGGYEDGYTGNEQKINPKYRPPLEELWLACHAALACDSEVTLRGNGHYPFAVMETLRWCEENGFLTLPEKPSMDEVAEYALEAWGVERENLMEI